MMGIFKVKIISSISCVNASNYNNFDTFGVPRASIM